MRTFDLTPLYRSAVGFDRMMSVVHAAQNNRGVDAYPPYNIVKKGDDAYQVTVAVAGFGAADLEIEVRDSQLVIVGKNRANEEGIEYLHRGIGRRAFERRFQLADYVEVKAADMKDGLLIVDLVRELPEAMKPRKIKIHAREFGIDGKTAKAA